MAHALELKLTHEQFNPSAVFDGASAVEALGKEKFDIVLLDLMMPQMDGFEVLRQLKEKKLHAGPVMVMTNLSQPEDEKKARELGASDFLVKSNTPMSEIVDRVKRAVS